MRQPLRLLDIFHFVSSSSSFNFSLSLPLVIIFFIPILPSPRRRLVLHSSFTHPSLVIHSSFTRASLVFHSSFTRLLLIRPFVPPPSVLDRGIVFRRLAGAPLFTGDRERERQWVFPFWAAAPIGGSVLYNGEIFRPSVPPSICPPTGPSSQA